MSDKIYDAKKCVTENCSNKLKSYRSKYCCDCLRLAYQRGQRMTTFRMIIKIKSNGKKYN